MAKVQIDDESSSGEEEAPDQGGSAGSSSSSPTPRGKAKKVAFKELKTSGSQKFEEVKEASSKAGKILAQAPAKALKEMVFDKSERRQDPLHAEIVEQLVVDYRETIIEFSKFSWMEKEKFHQDRTGAIAKAFEISNSVLPIEIRATLNVKWKLIQDCLGISFKVPKDRMLTQLEQRWIDMQKKLDRSGGLSTATMDIAERTTKAKFGRLSWNLSSSRWFDVFMGFVIVANIAFLALEATADAKGQSLTFYTTQCEFVFLCVYIAEMVMRLMSFRTAVFENWWVIYDFLLVLIGVFWFFVAPLYPTGIKNLTGVDTSGAIADRSNMRLFRLLRGLRLVCQFPVLYTLVQDYLVKQGRAIVQTLLLIGGLFACGGIYLMDMLKRRTAANVGDDALAVIHAKYKDVPGSMLSLVAYVDGTGSLGLYEDIASDEPIAAIFFILMLIFITVCLMNLIVATIVDGGEERHRQSQMMEKQFMEARRKVLLKRLFRKIVTNMAKELQMSGSSVSGRNHSLTKTKMWLFLGTNPPLKKELAEAMFFTTFSLEDSIKVTNGFLGESIYLDLIDDFIFERSWNLKGNSEDSVTEREFVDTCLQIASPVYATNDPSSTSNQNMMAKMRFFMKLDLGNLRRDWDSHRKELKLQMAKQMTDLVGQSQSFTQDLAKEQAELQQETEAKAIMSGLRDRLRRIDDDFEDEDRYGRGGRSGHDRNGGRGRFDSREIDNMAQRFSGSRDAGYGGVGMYGGGGGGGGVSPAMMTSMEANIKEKLEGMLGAKVSQLENLVQNVLQQNTNMLMGKVVQNEAAVNELSKGKGSGVEGPEFNALKRSLDDMHMTLKKIKIETDSMSETIENKLSGMESKLQILFAQKINR